MADKTTLTVGTLIVILLASVVYISFEDTARMRVDVDKSTFYIKLLDDNGDPKGRWLVSGREYVKLFKGTRLQYRQKSKITIDTDIDENKVTIVKTTPYSNGASIRQTYRFDGSLEDVELFPISHDIEINGGRGMILQYEIRDLTYDGVTKFVESPQSFGKRMKVEWQDGNYYAKVFQQKVASDKLIVKYRVKEDYMKISARLFDPIFSGDGNITIDGNTIKFNGIDVIPYGSTTATEMDVSEFNYTIDMRNITDEFGNVTSEKQTGKWGMEINGSPFYDRFYFWTNTLEKISNCRNVNQFSMVCDLTKNDFSNLLSLNPNSSYIIETIYGTPFGVMENITGYWINITNISNFDPLFAQSLSSITDGFSNLSQSDPHGLRGVTPILYMNFNDPPDVDHVRDNSINNHHGNNTGVFYNATGDRFGGGAFEWNATGNEDFIRILDDSDFDTDVDNSFSVSVWLKPGGLDVTATYGLYGRCDGSVFNSCNAGEDYLFYRRDAPAGIAWGPLNGQWTPGTILLAPDQWQHLAMVYDASNRTGYAYINGTLIDSLTVTSVGTDFGDFKIGGGANLLEWNGSMDDFKYYDRALSPEEVFQLNASGSDFIGKYAATAEFDSFVFVNTTFLRWNITYETATSNGTEPLIYSDSNLTAYYTLNNDFSDRIGTAVNVLGCTLCPDNGTGLSSNAMSFDGTDELFTAASPSFVNDQTGSASLWFKWDGVLAQRTFAAVTTDSAPNDDFFIGAFRPDVDNRIQVILRINGGTTLVLNTAANVVTDEGWHHWTVPSDASTIRTYLDGIEIATTASPGTNTGQWFASATDADTFAIGVGKRTTSTQHWNGSLDEVMIFNRTITPSEVFALYKTQLAGTTSNNNVTAQIRTAFNYNLTDPGLVSFYAFNADDDGIDETGTNDGACTNCPTFTQDAPVGGGYIFDGVNDVITVPDSNSLDLTTEGTLAAWIKIDTMVGDGGRGVISKRTSDSVSGITYTMFVRGETRTFGINIADAGGSDTLSTEESVRLNQWDHIAFTFDNGDYKLYINGVLDASSTGGRNAKITTHPVNIGKRTSGGDAQNNFNGSIDEVKIYNRSLSSADIKDLFELGRAHIQWGEYEAFQLVESGVTNRFTSIGSFMQYKTRMETNDTDPDSWIINYSVDSYNERPVVHNVTLNFSSKLNNTLDNLTGFINVTDANLDNITVDYNWYKDGKLDATTFIEDGILAYWPFNNDSFDYGQNNNPNVVGGSPEQVGGQVANAFDFDGSSDFFGSTIDGTLSFGALDEVALAGWFNTSRPAATGVDTIYESRVTISTTGSPGVRINTGGRLTIKMYIGGCVHPTNQYIVSTGTDITDGQMHHFATYYNSTDLLLYFDGVLVDSLVVGTPGLLCDNTAGWRIGNSFSSGPAKHFDGIIDELMIWNRSITRTEVEQLYFGGANMKGLPFNQAALNSSRTSIGEKWILGARGADLMGFGAEKNSSEAEVLNTLPNITSIKLNATSSENTTLDNLTGFVTAEDNIDNHNITFQFNWYKNRVLNATTLINDGSLRSYYPLNNDSLDYSGSNDGIATGATLNSSSGQLYGAFQFDGVNDFINLSNDTSLTPTNAISISAWFKTPSTPSVQQIISNLQSGSRGYDISISAGGNIVWQIGNGVAFIDSATSLNMLDDDVFHHVVGTWDGGLLRIYVDGVEGAYDTQDSTATISPASGDTFIGIFGPQIGGPGNFFNGTIDEVMIFNKSLSDSEVLQLYFGVVNMKGIPFGEAVLNSSLTSRGENWTLGARGGDFLAFGDEVNSSKLEILNAAPVVDNVKLNATSSENLTGDDLTGFVTASDADGDNITIDFNWYKDGKLNATTLIDNGSLVSYYPLNNDTLDYAGTNDGVITGDVVQSDGVVFGGYDFGGSDDFISLGNPPSLNITSEFTISAWANPQSSPGGNPAIYSYFDSGLIELRREASIPSYVIIMIDNESVVKFTGDFDLPFNQWNHLAGTWNGTHLLFYVNGLLNSTLAAPNPPKGIGNSFGAKIGARSSSPADPNDFDGRIDEVIIWNRSLSSSEIAQIYHGSVSGGNILNSSQTSVGESWILGARGGDFIEFGDEINSSPLEILNAIPTVDSIKLNATSADNLTTDNLTGFVTATDNDGDNITIDFNWYKDGVLNATTLLEGPNLFSYWPFNNDTLDYGGSFNGINNGAVFNASGGIIYGAFDFDGNEFINTTAFSQNDPDGLSIAFWLNENDPSLVRALMAQGAVDTIANFVFLLRTDGSTGGLWAISDGFSQRAFAVTTPTRIAGEWNHWSATWNRTDMVFYFNGELASSTTSSVPSLLNPASRSVFIAQEGRLIVNNGADGTMDEVMLFNRSLELSEIQQLYLGGRFMEGLSFGEAIMNSSQTSVGESWILGARAGDFIEFGAETNSSPIEILADQTTIPDTDKFNVTFEYPFNRSDLTFSLEFDIVPKTPFTYGALTDTQANPDFKAATLAVEFNDRFMDGGFTQAARAELNVPALPFFQNDNFYIPFMLFENTTAGLSVEVGPFNITERLRIMGFNDDFNETSLGVFANDFFGNLIAFNASQNDIPFFVEDVI